MNTKSTEYDSDYKGWLFFRELSELLRYRDLLHLLVFNNIKTRYKRSMLGVFWTLLNPILTMTVLVIAFSNLFRFSLPDYPVYLLTGLVIWNFFSQITTSAINAITMGGSLLRRIYLPRTVFSVAAVGSEAINLLLSLIPLFFIILLVNHPLNVSLLFVPVAVLLTAMFALGIGLLVSTLAVFFADSVHIYQILLMGWFYLTPIIYPKEILPLSTLTYIQLNPMLHLAELFRSPIYLGVIPDWNTIIIAWAWATASLLFGWWVFSRKADRFAYLI